MKARLSRLIGQVTAIAALCSVTATQAANTSQCLNRTEADGVITFALPSIITSLESRCRPNLPKHSALSTTGLDMASRMRPDADKAWPIAKIAFSKLSNGALPAILGDATLKPLLEAALVAGMLETVRPETCPMVDRFIDVLSPLPTDKLTGLITLLIELGNKPDSDISNHKKSTPFVLCPSRVQG